MNDVLSAISTVGFPIVACLLCGWYIKYQATQHRSEISELSKAIENNTNVMTKLLERMSRE